MFADGMQARQRQPQAAHLKARLNPMDSYRARFALSADAENFRTA
jgi:hypothetical protein